MSIIGSYLDELLSIIGGYLDELLSQISDNRI